ncbi:MAG: HAMP domain-containing sensor histidine kinase [Bacteroidota bacterium]|nr:HAMP domain-containing sensor histidine kinase [Bacteroidota bacterium]MDP4196425.1 HAMP domain-containing sensor histidine kinase [Bacteroidota bacterium]
MKNSNILYFSLPFPFSIPFRLLNSSSGLSLSKIDYNECDDCEIVKNRFCDNNLHRNIGNGDDSIERLKSEFFSLMSHEIRTPLNNILVLNDLLRNEFENLVTSELSDVFRIIEQSGKRIIRTFELMLFYSELKAGLYRSTAENLSVYEFICDNLFLEFKDIAQKKNLGFSIKDLSDSSKISVDPNALYQILNLVIDNALKFTKDGSVEILVISDENTVIVSVMDSGIGISDKYMDSIFEPFSQEEHGYTRSYEGNGLGLALVKEYCKVINAEVRIKSKKNEGTCFNIILNGQGSEHRNIPTLSRNYPI